MIGLAGVLLAFLAALVVVLLVIAPRGPRIPADRRRAPGTAPVSGLTRVTDGALGAIGRVMGGTRSDASLASALDLAGVTAAPSAFVLMVLCAALVLGALGPLLVGVGLGGVLLGVLFAALAPVGAAVLLSVLRGRRRAAFADQLDDALTLLAGSLRAGHSLLRAVDGVAQEVEAPMGTEFTRVVNETRLGRDLAEAFGLTAERMRSDDFAWIAQAVAINQEAGGNLAEVLEQSGRTIRERNQIRRQVRALSAEGRLSALVLMLLPVAVVLLLMITRPSYLTPLLTTVFGWAALVAAGILMIIGGLWMRVAVRVRF